MSWEFGSNWPSGFWLLECVDIIEETHDVKTFFMKVRGENGEAHLHLHRPGQFVTLRLRHGDNLIPRSYTVSSSPSRPMLMSLTIKRDPQGLVSRFMHDHVEVGSLLPVNGPGGNFDAISIDLQPNIIMLSGGSGITPVMSMLRYLIDTRQKQHHITFVHSARTPQDIIFRDELDLVASNTDTNVTYICEREAEAGMLDGLLDRKVLENLIPDIEATTILCCGPAPYMSAVKSILRELDFDMEHYHEESFGDPAERQNPPGASPETLTFDIKSIEDTHAGNSKIPPDVAGEKIEASVNQINFSLSGKTAPYDPGQTILEVATREGIAIATNCQMGLCGTCKLVCSDGTVNMDDEEGLTDEDRADNYVLTCCGRPSGAITIEV